MIGAMKRFSGIIGCAAAGLSVAMGAFGAHALKERLEAAGRVDVWQTAVDYQMWHALALLICACLPSKPDDRGKALAAIFFIAGICLFSGSLYWLALGGPGWLGPITPLGGLGFIAGWIALAVHFCRKQERSPQ
jgi:uncharacterized membrane protein YgdD (TMEM256/DUF423 family)